MSYREAVAIQIEHVMKEHTDAEKVAIVAERRDWLEIIEALRGEPKAPVTEVEALREAIDLLETCRGCDLVYNYEEMVGIASIDKPRNPRTVASVVDDFLAKHRPPSPLERKP